MVHWRWLYKRLLPTLQEAGCTSLVQLLQEYDRLVRRQPAYSFRSSSKLSRLLGVSPPLPSTQDQCSTLAQLLALNSCPLLSSPLALYLATFHCQYRSQVASLLQQLCQGGQVGQAVSSLAALQEQYREQVEEGRGKVGVESFLALQTVAVREQVGEVCTWQ